ncbi:MAG: succinate dehydrogenase flavoprotein subunit [Actinomycetota bacterium]|nr:succinate dehydrogenase flavoprotein subunit [Actinomycetota bacterium]PLS74866.1 MAG: succinate dehydrogenase flavoprotein subunit [Actinomycetota bacterium]
MQHHTFDAVIVGAGGAGLRAAIETAGKCRTAVITKLYPTRSHTGAAQGGMCAALANVEEDSWEWHLFDTIKGGDYLVDQPAAEIMCREAIDAVIELEHFGLPFNRTPAGRIDQRRFGGHTRNHGEAPVRRACYSADRTGHMILQTLYQQCVARDVVFFNEYQVLDMALVDGRVGAVIAYELATGNLHVFHTKAALFATGGFGKMFKVSSNAHTLTGDGPGLLYRRGIPMQDMEFFQFHPTGIYKLGILLSEAARGEGGILRNAEGERFMERYAPTVKDLAPRDMVSRAIQTEILDGRGVGPDHDAVHLDLTHLPPEQIDEKLPDITEFVRTYLGIEPKTAPVPIQPTAHYAMGGIPTNIDAEVVVDTAGTVVPGLYAAGECACVSVHGANRLGTNSLLDIVVFGRRGGRAMVDFVRGVDRPEVPAGVEDDVRARIDAIVGGAGGEKVARVRADLQAAMTEKAFVYRTEESLAAMGSVLGELRERYARVVIDDKGPTFNYDLTEALELGYLIDLAEALVVSARARTESRGAHFRDDHPLRDDANWMRHSLVSRGRDGTVELTYKPVVAGDYLPMERKY